MPMIADDLVVVSPGLRLKTVFLALGITMLTHYGRDKMDAIS